MAKRNANAAAGAARAPRPSRKRQASNADQKPTKRTRRTAPDDDNEADDQQTDDDDEDEDDNKPQDEEEEGVEEDEEEKDGEVQPAPSRGGKRDAGVKRGPPQSYAGRDHTRIFTSPLPCHPLTLFSSGKPCSLALATTWQSPIRRSTTVRSSPHLLEVESEAPE